jgi:sigma-E factor negative regulatory protein RseB
MSGSPVNSNRVIKHRRSCKAAFLFGMVGWLAQAAVAAEPDEALRWLEKVAQASRTVDYEGVFVYRHKGELEAMRVIHRVDDDGERERLFSLTGVAREIVRDDEKVTCILPDSRAIVVDRRQSGNPLSQLVPQDVESLSRSYILEVAGDGRVAGRSAKQIDIRPRDEFRFGYRLWIDQETGLLLQADVFDDNGEAIEQLMFAELRTPVSIPTSWLQPQSAGEGYTWYRQQPVRTAKRTQESNWQFNDLPPAFELVLHELRRMPGSDRSVEHLLFSDGLANVSVYIEKTVPDQAFEGHSEMGAVKAYGRLLDKTTQITAVGEVPAVTVERIGESITPRG